jgi:hypothetical protein
MKALIVAIGLLVAGISVSASAQTQNNPWCAYFTGGTVNCGFATFQQCLEAIHGKTGLCDQNSQDASPADTTPEPHHRRRRHSDQN